MAADSLFGKVTFDDFLLNLVTGLHIDCQPTITHKIFETNSTFHVK